MRLTRCSLQHPAPAAATPRAITIGNFDGVHRGHQAMLALLGQEAHRRGLPACALSFAPHPRDWFARRAGQPDAVPPRVATTRDNVAELARCGVDELALMRFDARLAALPAEAFVREVLVARLGARLVLVGDDFRFGAGRLGDHALLESMSNACGYAVARLPSYQVQGQRVSSSAVRAALAAGDMDTAAALLGRPYGISGRVAHGRKLGRGLGFPTLNVAFGRQRPAAQGIFVARVHGLAGAALAGVASLGVRPTIETGGRVLLEVFVLDWPAALGSDGAYGRCVSVELLHKLHDERRYPSLAALQVGIAQDVADARAWWATRG